MSSKTDLKILHNLYRMEVKEHILSRRPSLTEKSLATYVSIMSSLAKTLLPEEVFDLNTLAKLDNVELIFNHIADKKPAQKKVILSACSVIFDKPEYRDEMTKVGKALKANVDKQEMTEEQANNWVDSNEINELLEKMKKSVAVLYRKDLLTQADCQEIQQYILLCLFSNKYIPPRRSMDIFSFKIRNIDPKIDNFMDKDTFVFNNFKGRIVNTTKGVREIPAQVIPIPPELKKIISKWIKATPENQEYLLVDVKNSKLNASQINQRLNKMFSRPNGAGCNQMRHTFLTEKYGDMIETKKELEKDMKAMGSSIIEANYYIQSKPSNITKMEVIVSPENIENEIVTPKKVRKPYTKKTKIIVEE